MSQLVLFQENFAKKRAIYSVFLIEPKLHVQ